MDELAASLLSTLKRSSAPIEAKISLFNSLKSSIKHQRIPESAQPTTIECIRLTITSQSSLSLVNAGFSALGHLIKRLTIQEQTNALFTSRANLLPLLLEKLGDVREANRIAASQALCDLWPVKQTEVEKVIREGAIQGSNARAKETGMDWVTKMHTTQGLQFRSFVPPMVECLEDADGAVRESAKTNIVELFKDARDGAKADLKKQLIALNVRKSIATHILSQLQIAMPAEVQTVAFSHTTTHPEAPLQNPSFTESTTSQSSLPPAAEVVQLEPLYVQSQRDLEDIFRDMQPCFEDKEKEENWRQRDSNVLKLRRLLQGNGFTDHPQAFVAGIKTLLSGILKVANSLRTTMSTNGCQLIQELAKTLGPALDPMVEILLQGFDKMSASTKHISAQNADLTMDTIFSRVTCNVRLVSHIWNSCQDKNMQPRCFAAGWLKTVLKKQVYNKQQFDHSGSLELVDKCIRKCLLDSNPKVRETMRSTYWAFAQAWPDRAETIIATLDAKSRQLLEKDPSNPNSTNASTSFTASVGPIAAPNPRATSSAGRLSLKETIAAQKKASLAAKRLPERPSSAMSTFSPVRQPPQPTQSITRPANSNTTQTSTRVPPPAEAAPVTRPTLTSSNTTNGHGLMSAPMRRPRRPDLPRPATADLYSGKPIRSGSPPKSPAGSPSRLVTKDSVSNFSGGSLNRAPPGLRSQGADESLRSPKMSSPRASPLRTRQKSLHSNGPAVILPATTRPDDSSSSTLNNEENVNNEDNFTMVIPSGGISGIPFVLPHRARSDLERSDYGRHSLPSMAEAEEDNFTLVIPDKANLSIANAFRNAQLDLISFADEPLPPVQPATAALDDILLRNEIMSIDFGDEAHNDPAALTAADSSAADEPPLIVFEDPTLEDAVAPPAEAGQRAALEELALNRHHAQPSVDSQDTHKVLDPLPTPGKRSASPTKRNASAPIESPLEDRAEVLKTRRLLASGIEKIKSKALDAHGFRRLQELVKNHPQNSDLPFADLLGALTGYLDHSAGPVEAASTRALIFRTQALACIRAVAALPLQGDAAAQRYPEAICAVVLEAAAYEKASLFGNDLDKTVDELVVHAGAETAACFDRVVERDWRRYSTDLIGRRRIVTTSLSAIRKLMGSMKQRGEGLDQQQRQRAGTVVVQYLGDVDADVRKAGIELCLDLYTAFGKDNQEEFWRGLKGVGEGQLNLLAYYMARRGLA